jgi:hypothetical protein
MKLIIAGGRDIKVTAGFIEELIRLQGLSPKEIVSGGARGIDQCGEIFVEQWNQLHKTPGTIPSSYVGRELGLKIFEADWEEHGKAAGPIRNQQMAQYADALLLIWDGESRGSANMKQQMEEAGKPVFEMILKNNGKLTSLISVT